MTKFSTKCCATASSGSDEAIARLALEKSPSQTTSVPPGRRTRNASASIAPGSVTWLRTVCWTARSKAAGGMAKARTVASLEAQVRPRAPQALGMRDELGRRLDPRHLSRRRTVGDHPRDRTGAAADLDGMADGAPVDGVEVCRDDRDHRRVRGTRLESLGDGLDELGAGGRDVLERIGHGSPPLGPGRYHGSSATTRRTTPAIAPHRGFLYARCEEYEAKEEDRCRST